MRGQQLNPSDNKIITQTVLRIIFNDCNNCSINAHIIRMPVAATFNPTCHTLNCTPVFDKHPEISFISANNIHTKRRPASQKSCKRAIYFRLQHGLEHGLPRLLLLRSSPLKGSSRPDSTPFLLPLSPSQHIRHTVGTLRLFIALRLLYRFCISGHFMS